MIFRLACDMPFKCIYSQVYFTASDQLIIFNSSLDTENGGESFDMGKK